MQYIKHTTGALQPKLKTCMSFFQLLTVAIDFHSMDKKYYAINFWVSYPFNVYHAQGLFFMMMGLVSRPGCLCL